MTSFKTLSKIRIASILAILVLLCIPVTLPFVSHFAFPSDIENQSTPLALVLFVLLLIYSIALWLQPFLLIPFVVALVLLMRYHPTRKKSGVVALGFASLFIARFVPSGLPRLAQRHSDHHRVY
ncbi:MAG: hypothetical protein ABSB29_05840 [Nitrososphaerales archaeon]|jgi:D-alanyl-lipoteichoic acid acyltransferase DltB (MBOAT superfamily)